MSDARIRLLSNGIGTYVLSTTCDVKSCEEVVFVDFVIAEIKTVAFKTLPRKSRAPTGQCIGNKSQKSGEKGWLRVSQMKSVAHAWYLATVL